VGGTCPVLEGDGGAARGGLGGRGHTIVVVGVDAVGELEIPVVPDHFVARGGLGAGAVEVAAADVRGGVAGTGVGVGAVGLTTGVGGVADVGTRPAAVLGGQRAVVEDELVQHETDAPLHLSGGPSGR